MRPGITRSAGVLAEAASNFAVQRRYTIKGVNTEQSTTGAIDSVGHLTCDINSNEEF